MISEKAANGRCDLEGVKLIRVLKSFERPIVLIDAQGGPVIVYRRRNRCRTVCAACNVVVVKNALASVCALASRADNGIAAGYKRFRPLFAARALCALSDPPRGYRFALVRSNRIALWRFGHYAARE